MDKVDRFFVHCSATTLSWAKGRTPDEQVAGIRAMHVGERGWSDIGYHSVITWPNGIILPGRPETRTGAHVLGYNEKSLGVCLVGGHGSSEFDRFEDHYTPEMWTALLKQIRTWFDRYQTGQRIMIHGHNEVAAKACPGFQVADEFGREFAGHVGIPLRVGARALRRGDRGLDVEAIQKMLLQAFRRPLKADGLFGPRTEAAVKGFQLHAGLTPDGIVGPKTRAALTREAATPI